MNARGLATAFALAAGAFCLYLPHLASTPPSLADDEITISMTAHSIATTGMDLSGRSWPLYIQITDGSWFHPVIVYAIALVLQVLPLTEFAIRLPTVCAGVANIVLMYFIGRVVFRREALAVLSAVLLALTPVHFIHSRFALEYLYPLPFILGWLLCLCTALDRDDWRWLFASTVVLGLGFYSYIGSVFMMPVYMALTGLALLRRKAPARAFFIAASGFAIPLLSLFVPWFVQHRAAFDNTVGHYLIYDTSRLNPLQGSRELLGFPSVVARTSVYWSYLNPSFLFLDLTSTFMYSTRTTGVFLLPLALFVPVGLYQAFQSGDPVRLLLVLGFLTAPLAAVLVAEPNAIGRALELLPFGVLLAVVGIVHLWSGPHVALRRTLCLAAAVAGLVVGVGYAGWTLVTQGLISASTPSLLALSIGLGIVGILPDDKAWRLVVIGGLALALFQFQQFAADYFTEYRARASEAFLYNRRGGLEYLIERARAEDVPAIYLTGISRDVDMTKQHWRFYLVKHGREDLLARTVLVGESPLEVATMPPGSAILARLADPRTKALAASGELTLETTIPEPGGPPALAIYRRPAVAAGADGSMVETKR